MSNVAERRKENPSFRMKPTNTELRRRLDIVESLVIDCASVPEIMRYFSEKENLRPSRRTIEGYVHIVEKRIQKAALPRRELEIEKAKRRFEKCFARAITGPKKNIPAAIAAQRSLNHLLGLNPPKDSEGEMSVERLAELVVLQQKQMTLARLGKEGIWREIVGLAGRYKDMGEDMGELLQTLTHIAGGPKNESTESELANG